MTKRFIHILHYLSIVLPAFFIVVVFITFVSTTISLGKFPAMEESKGEIVMSSFVRMVSGHLFLVSALGILLFVILSFFRLFVFKEKIGINFWVASSIVALIFLGIYFNVGGVLYWYLG